MKKTELETLKEIGHVEPSLEEKKKFWKHAFRGTTPILYEMICEAIDEEFKEE